MPASGGPRLPAGPLVLMYHGFGDRSAEQDPCRLFTSRTALEQQLSWLLRHGYRPVHLDGFLHGLEVGRWPSHRSFLVTIDDGYVSTLDIAAPVLSTLGVPAVLFALPGRLDGESTWTTGPRPEPLLAADSLRELATLGVTVASHGWDHRSLVGLDATELDRQTTQTRTALADVTGTLPSVFAYPFGEHDAAARQAVSAAGFRAAFAVYDAVDRFSCPRVSVDRGDSLGTFSIKASAPYVRLKVAYNGSSTARHALHTLRRVLPRSGSA